jgi:hypothetical protein
MFQKIICILLCIKIISIYSLDPPYGQLKIQGVHVTDLNGNPVQLRGMSLFWSQWMDQFWSEETLLHLRNEWNSNLVRAPMGIMYGGYLDNPEAEYDKVKTVVEAAIKLGIYVIVDWHEERADEHIPQVSYNCIPFYVVSNHFLSLKDQSSNLQLYEKKIYSERS